MNESENYKFKLPSRDSEDIADINEISDNFRIADQILKNQEVELGKKIEGSVATEISSNSKSTEFPPASLVFENVYGLSRSFDRKIEEAKDEFENENKSQKDFISALNKRVINLEQAIVPSPFETDGTTAYRKDVPSNALPFAEVEKIGGMTYKDGDTLRSAPVEEVESVGANLFDFAEKTTTASGYIFRGLFLPQRIKAGTYTFSFRAKNYTPTNQFQCTFLNSKGVVIADSQGVFLNETCIFTFTITEEAVVAELYVNSTIGGTFYDFMLNRGSTALPYSPYFRNTLTIPSAVQAKNGINEDVYDFIEWREDGTIKNYECVGAVDMGMLDWLKGSPTNDGLSNTFYTRFFAMANRSPLLCSKFTQVVQTGMWEDITNGEMLSANDNYIVVATNHTDATAFKSAMAGVMLYYELANPIITDISDILTEDNYIGVEGGGTVTMVNEHQFAVPSSITYQVKGDA